MRFAKIMGASATAWLWLVCLETTAQGQGGIDPQKLAAATSQLSQARTLLESLPGPLQDTLSAGAQNTLELARNWAQVETGLAGAAPAQIQAAVSASGNPMAGQSHFDSAVRRVSDPSKDFAHSIVAGFTQSETSTAWCGNHVVVGFNSSRSYVETWPLPIGLSLAGASISSDRGVTFHDIGFINPGPNLFNFVEGDPVVTCVPGPLPVFYYSQIFGTGSASVPVSAVAISKSTDGGATWPNPVTVAPKSARTHFLDKPWSAIDPTNHSNLFITYTDFDTSGTVCGATHARTAIEMSRSTDGGVTWTAPAVIVQACNISPTFPSVQGSQVAVDFLGNVYVAWEDFASSPGGSVRDLKIVRSTDHGLTFGPAVLISPVTYTGNGGRLQGGFRNNEFPSLAIGPVTNNISPLYVVWNDGRNTGIPDVLFGRYGFGDILLSRSTNGGATWSAPVRVNNDPFTHMVAGRTLGTDHFQPGLAVDKTGNLGVCWYDRSSDPLNFLIGRKCAVSSNGGALWSYSAFSENWSPFHAADAVTNTVYMGDYDSVASDSNGANSGFLGAFGFVSSGHEVLVPNQDVLMFAFQDEREKPDR